MAGGVVKLEQAKSGRSTCRASGEPIAKGEWRVGFETWISGRVAMAWMVSVGASVSDWWPGFESMDQHWTQTSCRGQDGEAGLLYTTAAGLQIA